MKKRKKHPPTIPARRRTDADRAAAIAGSGRNDSRGKWNPEFFAKKTNPGPNTGIFARVCLRNKKGDVFLCWRDGKRVRNFYVGRRKQKPPTRDRAAAPDQVTSTAAGAIEQRRGKSA